jgi:hypothetical protein
MTTLALYITAAMLGSDVGWERLQGGGMEYIIQLNPQEIDVIRSGEAIRSDIHRDAGEVRSYRIQMGTARLPRDIPPMPPRLAPDPAGKPLGPFRTSFADPDSKPAVNKPQPSPAAAPIVSSQEPAKPWLPLTCTLLGLFASLGANVYLGWIAWEFRQRCHAAVTAT